MGRITQVGRIWEVSPNSNTPLNSNLNPEALIVMTEVFSLLFNAQDTYLVMFLTHIFSLMEVDSVIFL